MTTTPPPAPIPPEPRPKPRGSRDQVLAARRAAAAANGVGQGAGGRAAGSAPPPSIPAAIPPGLPLPGPPSARGGTAGGLTNYRTIEVQSASNESQSTYVREGLHPEEIREALFALTDNWPRLVGPILFAPRDDFKPRYLRGAPELFAYIPDAIGRRTGAPNPVDWTATGVRLVTKQEFCASVKANAISYKALSTLPHEPAMPGYYYLHPPVQGGDGTALANLLSRFCPATPVDADLLLAFFLTLFWGGDGGSRPGFLFTAADNDPRGGRGVGKSTVTKIASYLLGDANALDLKANSENIADLKTRLLSEEGLTARLVKVDNVKSHKFAWADLEGLITDSTISGKCLYVGESSRPNAITYTITLNGASLSRDMAERYVIVQMARPVYSGDWEASVKAFVDANRWAIIGDIVARLKQPAKPLDAHNRWGTWGVQVLAKVNDPNACMSSTAKRQADADDDTDEEQRFREQFEKAIADGTAIYGTYGTRTFSEDANNVCVRFTSQAVIEITRRATGDRSATATKAGGLMRGLTGVIHELRKKEIAGRKFWQWVGDECPDPEKFYVIDYDPKERKFSKDDG